MGENIADGLKELRIIMPVDGALIHSELAVDILMVDYLTVPVDLIGVPLCTEGYEHRQRAEIVDMVIDRPDAQGADVGDYHGAVEGTRLDELLRQPAEIVHDAQNGQCETEQEARRAAQRLRHVLGVVVAVGGLDLIDLRRRGCA